MNKPDPNKGMGQKKPGRPLYSFWGFRLGCATMYWAAAFVVITNALALYFNVQAGRPFNTDRRLTWVMAGLLLMLAYHNFMGWWPFPRRKELSPEYQRWMEARRRREEAERAAAEAGQADETMSDEDTAAASDESAKQDLQDSTDSQDTKDR